MATIGELQGTNPDYLCSNPAVGDPASNIAHIYDDGCSASEAASILRSNLGPLEWHQISRDTIYTDEANNIFNGYFGGYGEGETKDEAIEHIVKEVISKLTKEVDLEIVPEIEKYHIKHK